MKATRLGEVAYAAMRLVVGLVFACHGAGKLFGAFGQRAASGNAMMLVAGGIELLGGLFIALGLFTSVAAFVSSGEMAVAYFMAHAPKGFWPIQNEGEPAVVYCFVFLAIAALGGGLYSLDGIRLRRTGPQEIFSPSSLSRARIRLSQDRPL